MALLDITTAAKIAGVSRQTIYRKMLDGSLSWETNKQGKRRIETSELMRIFDLKISPDEILCDVTSDTEDDTMRKASETLEGYRLAVESLKSQVETERLRAARAESEVDFLRTALGKAQDDVQKLLTHQTGAAITHKNPWWKFWS